MLAHVARRCLIALITLLLISFVIYGLIRAMPGDPAILVFGAGGAGDPTVDAQRYEEMRAAYGLDKPWLVAYFLWLGDLFRGDLGLSLHRHVPVRSMIVDAAGPTLLLSTISLALSYLLSLPLGLHAARRSGKWDEHALSAVLYILYSIPSYVAAIFLLLFLSVKLEVFPLFGMTSEGYDALSTWQKATDLGRHMILPVTCYTYGTLASFTRFVRANVVEALRQDYIRTARAKGVGEVAILVRHAFRNSLIPFVTHLGLSLPALMSGSVIIERIFTWPGMGNLFLDSISTRDYPLIMGITLVFSVLILLGGLLADILYGVVDPRVTHA